MGLDQYAWRLKVKPLKAVDFKIEPPLVTDPEEARLFYWRKHADLQGWMENLYRAKGGSEEFNCTPVLVEAADLDRLEQDVMKRQLPPTQGFFFGQSEPEDDQDTLEFIAKARKAIQEGSWVAYDSWW